MEATTEEQIVIVGAGIAGLTTALGLHRLGIRSLVLESSDNLRTTGFAIGTWPNAWRALDAAGIGDSLRRYHHRILGLKTYSAISAPSDFPITIWWHRNNTVKKDEFEVRCLQRKNLLETLARELPAGTIRYSSKVVSIEESGHLNLIHLADGSILKAKVLIGCDGVNSAVAKWLGFKKPAFTGRAAIRGYVDYGRAHGLDPIFLQCFGEGVRFGLIPYEDNSVYWFFTWSPSPQKTEMEHDPAKMKQFVLRRLGDVPTQARDVFERTEPGNMIISPLRYRHPWELATGKITKGTVCVAGDAFHPMTPDLAQGACSALEDGVVLARSLARALASNEIHGNRTVEDERRRIEAGLKEYAKERRWRGVVLVAAAYLVGVVQQGNGKVISLLMDRVFAAVLARGLQGFASYDCGKLSIE